MNPARLTVAFTFGGLLVRTVAFAAEPARCGNAGAGGGLILSITPPPAPGLRRKPFE